MDQIEQRFRAEPTGPLGAHGLVRVRGVFVVDLDGGASSAGASGVGHELGVAALFHAQEPEDGGLDGVADGEKAVVLEQDRLVVRQRGRDVLALFLGEHDAVEGLVDDVVVVEGAAVLADDVEFAAEGAEGAAVDAVAVARSVDAWARVVDGGVDHEGGGVEESRGPTVDDVAVVVHLDQIRRFDEGEGEAERVHPEG